MNNFLTALQHIQLFSAIQLKAVERYEIHIKCIEQNKWCTIGKRILYRDVQTNICHKRNSTVPSNSLTTSAVKYLCLTLLYCWHSRSLGTTVNTQLQEGHCGGCSGVRKVITNLKNREGAAYSHQNRRQLAWSEKISLISAMDETICEMLQMLMVKTVPQCYPRCTTDQMQSVLLTALHHKLSLLSVCHSEQ